MMKGYLKKRLNVFVLLVTVCQLFNTFCSRKHYPELSASGIKVRVEQSAGENEEDRIAENKPVHKNEDLKAEKTDEKPEDFVIAGTGKKLDTNNVTADEIIETARKYLGIPHCMGGLGNKCLDCSGFVLTVFADYGILLPHSSQDQSRYGMVIKSKNDLIPGDLVFFTGSYKTNKYITHCGIYTGNNEFIHTSSSFGVTITSLDDRFWKNKFVYGTRILKQ